MASKTIKIILMKKFEVTKLSKLRYGDRFYFPAQRHSILYTFIENKDDYYFYENERGNQLFTKKDKKVVYLRNIND